MSRAALLAAALVLAPGAPARAADAPAAAPAHAPAAQPKHDIAVDPRFELMGVIRQLSGLAKAGEGDADYRRRIDARFAAFRAHPAVELFKDLCATPVHEETCATILIYFGDPPELRLKDKAADIHYLNADGQREEMQRFLWEMRDFARASDFMAFFKQNAEYYGKAEAAARRDLGTIEPVADIEALLGIGLDSRSHYVLALLAAHTHSFIVPYPLPPASAGTKSFEVHTIAADPLPSSVWQEPLYVFIDPSFYYFEKLNIPDPAAFYGPDIARCRAVSPECTKHYVVSAIVEHLNRKTQSPGQAAGDYPDERDRRYVKALSARLDEYERERKRYPTLWTFYPRLFSVFHELAYPGKTSKLAVPADPAIRTASDFFDPAVIRRLSR
jgi:hypothetical protein